PAAKRAINDPKPDVGGVPGPVVGPAAVYARIITLLDQAQTDLQAAGSSFAMTLSSGFAGFDTPPNFLKFNRALRARVAVYRSDYPAALTALNASFVNTSSPLTLGAYHVFSTSSGDA